MSASQARLRLERLIAKGCQFEIKDVSRRSHRQNAYLHLIIGWFCAEFGYKSKDDFERIKRRYYKIECNPAIFIIGQSVDRLSGEKIYDCRSSADLTTEEMSLSITRFRNWASQEHGVYLPSADEQGLVQEMERDLARLRTQGWIDY